MIVVTGATGRTGRAATEALLAKGDKVRVVGRDVRKMAPFVERGAAPYVGNVEDVASMTEAFKGASTVYLVLPEDISQQDLAGTSRTSFRFLRSGNRQCPCAVRREFEQYRRSAREEHRAHRGLTQPGAKAQPNRWAERPPPARSLFHGKSMREYGSAAFDRNAAWRSARGCANAMDRDQRYRLLCRQAARCPRLLPAALSRSYTGSATSQ